MHQKVDEREATAQYQVAQVDTKCADTDKAIKMEQMHIRSRGVAREFKSDDRPDLYAETPQLEALKATISIAANYKETFSVMHIDVSRAYFHAKAQRLVLVRSPVEDRLKRVCMAHGTQHAHVQSCFFFSTWAQLEESLS